MSSTQEIEPSKSPEEKQKQIKNRDDRPSTRPFKYAMIVRKLEQAFSIGCTVGEACLYAGISKATFYNWCKANKRLLEGFEQLQDKPILKARQTVVNSLDDPNNARWYLERKRKDEFSPKVEMEHQVEDEDKQAIRELVSILKDGHTNKATDSKGDRAGVLQE